MMSDSPTSQKNQKLASPPAQVEFRWIGRSSDLADHCDRWRRHEAVAIDTEFVRERTFYPALGLVQIATPDEIALVDPKVVDDPEPLIDLLRDPKVVKVLHSGSEDLETFRTTWDVLPEGLRGLPLEQSIARELDWVRERLA